jgi:hypothetical protein
MKLGSLMLCSTPSVAAVNQLALTVTERRGSLADDRAAALTLSSAVANSTGRSLRSPSPKLSSSDDNDVIENVIKELDGRRSEGRCAVSEVCNIDLVAHEFDSNDNCKTHFRLLFSSKAYLAIEE